MALATLVCPVRMVLAGDGQLMVPEGDVHVERSAGGFKVDFTTAVAVPPALAWAVLTDFEHMAEFVPNLTSSQVTERSESKLTVVQKGVVRHGLFEADFESVREITLTALHEIRAHGVGGNIRRMDSLMQLQAEGAGTRLTYRAQVLPSFWFPPLIGPAIVRRETAEQFSAIVREMLRRHLQSALK